MGPTQGCRGRDDPSFSVGFTCLCKGWLRETQQPSNIVSLRSQCRLPGLSQSLQGGISGSDPWFRKIPWRRKWQPTPVCLPGESHGQRSLVGYSPWGHQESDTTD